MKQAGFVKNPISALRFIPLSLRRTARTPHSTGFARLELGLFTKPSAMMTFYGSIKKHAKNIAPRIKIHRPQTDGFTLMEILVAVFILGIVVTTVMASFSMVFSTTAAMEEAGAAFEMGKNCLNRITTDLESIIIAERPFYKPPKTDGPFDPYRLQGTNESFGGTRFAKLRLASRAHVPLDASPRREGFAEIVYYVQVRPDGSFQLKRADHLYPYPRFEERSSDPVLCENVKSLAFLYYTEDGAESEAWDSESEKFANATPSMVAVQLEIATGDDVLLFQTTVRLPFVRRKQG